MDEQEREAIRECWRHVDPVDRTLVVWGSSLLVLVVAALLILRLAGLL